MRKLNTEEILRISAEEFRQAQKIPLVVVLDNVRSLHNVGSVFRTADAYLVEKIFLCGITATPPNAEIHKSALGAEFSVDWKYFADTLDAVKYLKSNGFTILVIEQAENSIFLNEFKAESEKKYAVILGNEVFGVQQSVVDHCENCLELPQFGTKHSLNVSVTAGIVIWEFWNKINLL
jgi:tRNA G18 (ribose-2'-O)-methylase SpoU